MNANKATAILAPEQVAECEQIGRKWGAEEVEAWREKSGGGTLLPSWVWGTYLGRYPAGCGRDDDDAVVGGRYGAADFLIDSAAREVWISSSEETWLRVGDYIAAGTGEDRDSGYVHRIHGDQVTIGWDSGVSTTQSVTALAELQLLRRAPSEPPA